MEYFVASNYSRITLWLLSSMTPVLFVVWVSKWSPANHDFPSLFDRFPRDRYQLRLLSVLLSHPSHSVSLWIITVLTVIMDNYYFGNDSFWDHSAQHGIVCISECLSSTWNTQNLCCHEDDCPLGEQPGDNILYIVITCLSVYCEHIAAHIVYNVKTVAIDFCTAENTPHAWGRTLLWVISRRELIWTQVDEQFSIENLEMSSDCDCQVWKIIKKNKKTNDKRLMTSLINPKEQTW